MGFSIEQFLKDLQEILDSDMKGSKKIKAIRHEVAMAFLTASYLFKEKGDGSS